MLSQTRYTPSLKAEPQTDENACQSRHAVRGGSE